LYNEINTDTVDITKTTTIEEVAPFLKPEHIEALLEKCDTVALTKPIIGFTVGEFLEATDEKYIMTFFKDPKELVTTAVGRLKQFKKEMEQIQMLLKQNEIKLTPEEQQAQKGVVFPSFQECVLVETMEWFGLHNLNDAEDIPLSNYLVMKRKKNADALFERRLNEIYANKSKTKNK